MQPELKNIKLSTIIFDEGLYPRTEGHDPETVQTYARDMDEIEAAGKYMSINADNLLLDGRHRMLAYKKRAEGQDPEVQIYQYPITSKLESFRLACRLQDRGKALSNDDRAASAKKLYALGDQSQKEIASALGVSPATISNWLSRTIKEEKEKKKAKAFDLWMACHTQEEIADAVDVPQRTVSDWMDSFSENLISKESLNWSNFTPPIYNVWTQQSKSNKVNHFGNSEPRWLENLIYLYTNPGDVVVDPFAGSASTIDVCKKRGRRYFVSDRKPIVEREHEIRKHDLVGESDSIQMPAVPRWKDVKLVYLDPPYWKQAEGQYSNDENDLANMSLEKFNKTLSGIINGFAKKIKNNEPKYIALIIQPTQWKAENREFVDHVGDMLRVIKHPVEKRYSVPYQSEQYNAQQVEWAKQNKTTLVLTREIIVWKI
jgi:DNA modification methylase